MILFETRHPCHSASRSTQNTAVAYYSCGYTGIRSNFERLQTSTRHSAYSYFRYVDLFIILTFFIAVPGDCPVDSVSQLRRCRPPATSLSFLRHWSDCDHQKTM